MKRLGRAVTFGVPVLAVAAVAFGAYLVFVYPHVTPDVTAKRTVDIEVAPGVGLDGAIDALTRAGVLERPWLFAQYAALRGAGDRLRSGTLRVGNDLSPLELLRRIARGYGRTSIRITVPEGFSRFEVAARLAHYGVVDEAAFLRATADPTLLGPIGAAMESAEGYLFPDTYELYLDSDPADVLRKMLATFRAKTEPLFARHAGALAELRHDLGFAEHDVVTLASIVEKEAALADEHALIAGVFLNRLRDAKFRPKRLDSDPTVSYGCLVARDHAPSCARGSGKTLTREMLRDPANPYNTRRHEGLPPGPISNPGRSAIEAVLAPAEHDYFYFVAKGGRRHVFSRTLDEHEVHVDRYRRGTR